MEHTQEELNQSVSDEVRGRLERKKPERGEIRELMNEHRHHLVRRTTSKLTIQPEVPDGVDATATAEVPDMFCFTCSSWVGVSGVELRGKPRSKADAYYLDGPPEDVDEAGQVVRDDLAALADYVLGSVEHIEDASDALEFISEELEGINRELDADIEQSEGRP